VGVVRDVTRPGEAVQVATLATLDAAGVGMGDCLVVGASTTTAVGGRMLTPRGYRR
jgi:precorrin-3B methylase